jgi:short-subunit dehydrogenase
LTAAGSRPVALVTGATAGIGRTFAEKLAARGHDLVLVARDVPRLEAVAAELAGRHGIAADVFPADLADHDQTTRLVERVGADAPAVLVNNAGFGTKGTLAETDPGAQEAMLAVHVVAPMRLTQAALPGMVARGRGAIINVSSVASFTRSAGNVNYCATKAYLRVMSEALAMELAGTGVRVQALCPGFTHTEFHDRMRTKKRYASWMWMTSDRVVEESLQAIADGGPVVCVPGLQYKAIVFLLRHAPMWLTARAARSYRRT